LFSGGRIKGDKRRREKAVRRSSRIAMAVVLAGAGMLPGAAGAATILGQSNRDGTYEVFGIDTGSGAATSYFTGPLGSGNNDGFSPNALGRGSVLYAVNDYDASGHTLLVNGANTGFVLNGTVAAGMAVGTSYYYVTNTGDLYEVKDAALASRSQSRVADLYSGTYSFGDIAYDGNRVYASYGSGNENGGTNFFATFGLDGSGFIRTATTLRYAGLAFAGGSLWGTLFAGNTLHQVSTASGASLLSKAITGLGGLGITDAATVPLPGAALLFGSALAGLAWVRRRGRNDGAGLAAS
jgi:hypothetical protein